LDQDEIFIQSSYNTVLNFNHLDFDLDICGHSILLILLIDQH